MKLLKSAHVGELTDAQGALLAQLGFDYIHPGPPWHERIPNGHWMPDYGLPVIWQASQAGWKNFCYTRAQIENVTRQPRFDGTFILGNEQNDPHGATPAATPQEYVDSVIQNLLVILSVAPKPKKLILALGSKRAIDNGWAREMLLRFRKTAPRLLDLFDAVGVNYYHLPLNARAFVHWLDIDVHEMLAALKMDYFGVVVKEIGIGRPSATPEEVAHYVERIFILLREKDFEWLDAVEWFAANNMANIENMDYAPLLDERELTPAGRAWAAG